MKITGLAALALATLAPLAVTAQPAYKAPRTASGQPDIGGYWSNATLTPMQRDSRLGERLVYTPAEAHALEADEAHQVDVGNKRTDPNAPVNAPNGLELKPSFLAAGGDVGGYNRGWLDPGHSVMRVGGQPRTSLLTTKDGHVPARKSQVKLQMKKKNNNSEKVENIIIRISPALACISSGVTIATNLIACSCRNIS